MILGKSKLPVLLERPRIDAEPLSEPRCLMWFPSPTAKDSLKRLLEAQKKKLQHKFSERDILDSMDRLRQLQGDKEVDDILYALSDVGPSDGIKRKARDMIEERKRAK